MNIRLFFFLLFSFRLLTFGQELPFTHYTPEREVNPLPSSVVMMSYQDRLGYLWFVVYSSGLARYDGRSMELYTTEDGLPTVDVREVLEDREGRLWVCTEAGLAVSTQLLDRYPLGERVSFATTIGGAHLLESSVIENRAAIGPGGIWVGTRNNGIIRYRFGDDSLLTVDTLSTSIGTKENFDVRSMTMRLDGSVWVALGKGILASYDAEGKLAGVLNTDDGLPAQESDALGESASGVLYAGFVNGTVFSIRGKIGHPDIREIRTSLKSRITHIAASPESTMWISSEQSGVFSLDERSMEGDHYTMKNGLLSDLARSVLVDREGNIWISQIGGVSKLPADYAAFLAYTAKAAGGLDPYLQDASVNNVLPERQGSPYHGIWVATSGGGATFIGRNGEHAHIGTTAGLKSDWVHALALDRNGRLWIGTSAGFSCLALKSGTPAPRGQRQREVNLPQGPAVLTGYGNANPTIYTCEVLQLYDEKPNRSTESVWFAAYGTIYCFASGKWYMFGRDAGVPNTNLTSITMDETGVLWVGTRDRGLFRSSVPITTGLLEEVNTQDSRSENSAFAMEVVKPLFTLAWDEKSGAPANQIESLVFYDRILWVGNPEGLVGFNTTTKSIVVHLSVEDGLPGADVTSLAFSNQTRTLWLGTNGGMAEVDPDTMRVLRSLTKEDGLLDNEVWWYGSVRVGDDGRVYFGTAKGLAVFDPSKEERNEVPPIVVFRSVQQREDLGSNSITLRFAALSFADEHQVRFKTLLDGFEDEWSPETADVTMRYTNLPAFFVSRTYTAKVQARNNDGVWTSVPIAYSFSVQPPWWLRWWFTAFNLLLLGGLSYAFLHYRTLQLQRRSRELETIVEQRTVEIREKADEISRQKDELASKNLELEEKNDEIVRTQEQLIVQEKLASLGALTAGIAHEIKNPLNFVNNFSEVSVEIVQELREDLAAIREKLDEPSFKRLEASCLDLGENARKIHEHGKRADGIVKGMLEHSRGQTGEREMVNINALVDEYVTLAYHGVKGQQPEVMISFKKEYDNTIGSIEAFPGDLSRVILNVVNNACYAVNEKQKAKGAIFSPTIWVSTENQGNNVVIRIRDNGTGMPKDVADKIFNPFFTTKPTGKGTGLGLSLSHDIIAKQHGGTIEVDTVLGEFSEFRIILPKPR